MTILEYIGIVTGSLIAGVGVAALAKALSDIWRDLK